MKNKLFFIFLVCSITTAVSNVLLLWPANISEFKFEQNNTWTLEIAFSRPYMRANFDSICLGSLSGFSRIKTNYLRESSLLFVITSDSLTTPLSINRTWDCIKLYSYYHSGQYWRNSVDSLALGNYPGSTIDSLPEGYSICLLYRPRFCKDKSPTIGFVNDTAGTCGSLIGKLYDVYGNPVKSGSYYLDDSIALDTTGIFSTRIYARKKTWSFLFHNNYWTPLYIDTLYTNINPDSILQCDIHLKDTIVGVTKQNIPQRSELQIMNYPNPFNSSTYFYVKIPESLKYQKGEIAIYSITGKKVCSIPLLKNSLAKWNGRNSSGIIVSSGVYYYRLSLDNTIYTNGSMIFLK